jgi:beta-galactosidase
MSKHLFNEGWAYRTKVSLFAELGGGSAEWTDVTLPHDALIDKTRTDAAPSGAASGYFPSGSFEYRTILDVDTADQGNLMVLEFDGVYRDAMVYVNGALAGQHAFGYSRFTVRIDPYLQFGTSNEIRVTCRTHQDSRWYTGSGIYRDVHLIKKKPVHIGVDGVRITTTDVDSDRAIVDVATVVSNTSGLTVTIDLRSTLTEEAIAEVADDHSPVTLLPGTSATVRHRHYVESPALWSVETPSLYSASLQLRAGDEVVDTETAVFGIRRIQVDSRQGLRINGTEVKLRGACVHHDNGPLGAATIAAAEERRVRLLKDAGFNAIRSSHNPASSALLDACDRLGMFVIDEAFDVWTTGKTDFDYSSDFAQWWERDLESLVAKDVNHASVIMYSIGNEIPETGTADGGVWSRRLTEKLRTLDPNRPVTNGINGFVSSLDLVLAGMKQNADARDTQGAGVNGIMNQVGDMMNQISASPMVTERTAESFSVLDVAGMNYGDGRYLIDKTLFPNRVIAGTETFPAQIARNWAVIKANPHVIGDFTWTGWDYLGEAGLGSVGYTDGTGEKNSAVAKAYPWLAAWSGDIDVTGERRPMSFYREIVFGLRHEPYIAVLRPENYNLTPLPTPWSWSDSLSSWTWESYEGHPIRVEVYSDAEEIELLVNNNSVGRQTVGTELAFKADFDILYVPGTIEAVAYSDGREVSRTHLRTASSELVIQALPDRARITAGSGDLAFVRIALTDEAGVVKTGFDRSVQVTVSGSGVLQALGSARPDSDESFTSSAFSTFDGRVLAVIRPTGSGEIEIEISADGCTPQHLVIESSAPGPRSTVSELSKEAVS